MANVNNRVLPRLAPERAAQDPMVSLLRKCAEGTVDRAEQLAVRPGLTRGRQGIGEPPVLSVLGSSINSACPAGV